MDICLFGIAAKDGLDLRAFPDFAAPIQSKIPLDSLLIVIDYDEVWYATFYGFQNGFVMKRNIVLQNMSNSAQLVGRAKGEKLDVRRKADIATECIVQIPASTAITVIDFEMGNKWFITNYKGYTGYILKEDVTITQSMRDWYYGQTTVDDLNIRRKPSRSAVRWNNVWPKNRIALVRHVNENWYETLYRGEQAFVSSEFITLLACEVPLDMVRRMLYMAKPEIGRVNTVYFNGYTGQWCHRFADWLAMHAGTPKKLIPNTSNCGKGIVWFVNDTESGGFYFKNAEHKARMIGNYSTIRHLPKELTEEEEAYIPSPGDYIYFRWRNAAKDVNVSHVGIVSGISENKLTTVEGNAGGAVANRSYVLDDDRIVGYGKPRYDAVG